MKRVVSVLIAIAVLALPLNATAAVKAGATCSKLGATSTYLGKKYTCVKSGKKLVWNKGVAIAKPILCSKSNSNSIPYSNSDVNTYSDTNPYAYFKSICRRWKLRENGEASK